MLLMEGRVCWPRLAQFCGSNLHLDDDVLLGLAVSRAVIVPDLCGY